MSPRVTCIGAISAARNSPPSGPRSADLARQGVFVLHLPADVVPFGDDFGGVAHHHIDTWIMLLNPGIIVAFPV